MGLYPLLDYASVMIFALTGALVASRAQLDIVGFAFFACLTALGGGTVRDVLLDRTLFWIGQPAYLGVACGAALLVFFIAPKLESRYKVLLWLDAAALSVAVAAGTGIALQSGAPWPAVVVMGVATGCFGGLMRDVVSNEVPLVLKQGELYVSCALAGALAMWIAQAAGLGTLLSALAATGATFALRAGTLIWGWSLPLYRPRPPRV